MPGVLTLTTAAIAPMQAYNPAFQHGAPQLIVVGQALYLVTRNQIGAAPDNNLVCWKSTDFLTWLLQDTLTPTGPPLQNNFAQDAPTISNAAGTKFYTINNTIDTSGFPAVVHLVVETFDVATGLFTATSSNGPSVGGAGNQLWSISLLNSGKLMVTYTTAAPIAVGYHVVVYDPALDTWSAVTDLTADSSQTMQQVHDSGSDLTFVFRRVAATKELRCFTIDNTLVFNDSAVVDLTPLGLANGTFLGIPTITTDTNEVVLGFRFLVAGVLVQKVARATVAAAPVFSLDVVDDTTGLPAGSLIQQYDQLATPGNCAADIGGTLYLFYVVDNGELNNAASQTFLYYRFSTGPGVWSAPQLAFSSALSSEGAVPYVANVVGSDPVILFQTLDPVTFPNFVSLSSFILFGGSGPSVPLTVLQINAQQASVVILPDPTKDCD